MCTVLLPPGDNPIAVNKYIIYHVCPYACISTGRIYVKSDIKDLYENLSKSPDRSDKNIRHFT